MNRRYMVWIDANGRTRLTLVDSSVGAGGVETALAALSNAVILNSLDAALTVPGGAGAVAAQFQSVGDSAALTYTDAAGNLTVVQLPAPVAAVFKADLETVDATAVAAITAAVVGTVLTPAGNLVTAYVGGFRRKTQREDY